MKPIEKKEFKIINRAFAKNRPDTAAKCKISDITNKHHPCNPENGGHSFKFYRFDNYGVCSKCSDEILT